MSWDGLRDSAATLHRTPISRHITAKMSSHKFQVVSSSNVGTVPKKQSGSPTRHATYSCHKCNSKPFRTSCGNMEVGHCRAAPFDRRTQARARPLVGKTSHLFTCVLVPSRSATPQKMAALRLAFFELGSQEGGKRMLRHKTPAS